MTDPVNSLWPSDIRPDALSPFAILELQAGALAVQTKGILVGQVRVSHDDGDTNTHVSLDLVAPLLENFRRRILTATHRTDRIYPARVDADCFRARGLAAWTRAITDAVAASTAGITADTRSAENEAATDQEFRRLVEKVLHSSEVRSLAVSLIAQSNDVLKARQREAETDARTGKGPRNEEPVSAGVSDAPAADR